MENKELYESLELEITLFDSVDVIVTSGDETPDIFTGA